MKVKIKSNKVPFINESHIDTSYLKKAKRRQYKPFPASDGLHCKGNRFDYVVEWEIPKEKDREFS
ncbi:hypothetical protein [Sunxiuqinia indica]|uniref:hypothetical protein n=1 Tax=Sunxiuqinia indica TaxID=2692584 RepID=UPI001356D15B|nr:hypothetical protein [Sunxiuqinia indica]